MINKVVYEDINLLDVVSISGESVKEFDGKLEYLSTGDLYVNKIVNLEHVTWENKPSRANQLVEANDVIFAKMKDTRKTLIIDENTKDLIVSTGFYVLKPSVKIKPKFLFYFLNSRKFLIEKDKLCKGATQKALNNSGLNQIDLLLPKIEIQNIICDILDKSQTLVDKRKQQIKALDELVKSRFIEMFGDPILNPMGWDKKDLIDVCDIIVDCPHSTPKYTNENTGFMCIRTSIIKPNSIQWANIEYISESDYKSRIKRHKPKMGDIIYSREGAILGIAALVNKECNISLGQRLMLLSPSKNIINERYLCYQMNSEGIIRQVRDKIGGSASPHINVGDVKKFKVLLPPLNKQIEFSNFMKQVDKLKFEMESSLKELEDNFNSLMQKAFKGELFN